jgi:hypothetical protein
VSCTDSTRGSTLVAKRASDADENSDEFEPIEVVARGGARIGAILEPSAPDLCSGLLKQQYCPDIL